MPQEVDAAYRNCTGDGLANTSYGGGASRIDAQGITAGTFGGGLDGGRAGDGLAQSTTADNGGGQAVLEAGDPDWRSQGLGQLQNAIGGVEVDRERFQVSQGDGGAIVVPSDELIAG